MRASAGEMASALGDAKKRAVELEEQLARCAWRRLNAWLRWRLSHAPCNMWRRFESGLPTPRWRLRHAPC